MHRRIAISAIILAALAASGPAAAQGGPGNSQRNYSAEEARTAREAGQVISAREAIAIAMSRIPGSEYLDLFLSGGGMPVYTVRLRTPDGRRAEVLIDARTGAVLGVR